MVEYEAASTHTSPTSWSQCLAGGGGFGRRLVEIAFDRSGARYLDLVYPDRPRSQN